MEFSEERLKKWLSKYKFRDLTIEELRSVNELYPNITFSMNVYTFKDGSQKDLLNISGTVPVKFQGNSYNIPICLWILDSHPFTPPICFLKPTANMGISVGKHVDARGRIYLPYLQNWSHPQSMIIGLLKEMATTFEVELPLYSLSSSDAARQLELLSYISKITEGENNKQVKSKVDGKKNDGGCNKVTVIGAGDLGLACALSISAKGVTDKVVVLNCSEDLMKGGTMDLEIFPLPNVEISRDFSASADSKVVVLTMNSLGNTQSYLDLVQSNVELFRGIIPSIAHYSQHSILLVASQPVEIMTYVTWKMSRFPKSRVIGIGCNLDSARFQHIITNLLKAQTKGKDVWLIGEQGENKESGFLFFKHKSTEHGGMESLNFCGYFNGKLRVEIQGFFSMVCADTVTAWSASSLTTSQPSEDLTNRNAQQLLTDRAMEVLKGKGQKSWSVGLSIADLTDSILNNKRKVHSISTMVKGYYNINCEVFLSMPCVLGINGVTEISKPLDEDTVAQKLQASAASLHDLQQQLKL